MYIAILAAAKPEANQEVDRLFQRAIYDADYDILFPMSWHEAWDSLRGVHWDHIHILRHAVCSEIILRDVEWISRSSPQCEVHKE